MYMFALNIGELMKHRAYLSPEEEGFIGRERYSFNDMNRRVNQFSNYLLEQQIRQGERIALICKNHEDFITAFFGAAKLGIITVPINWRLGVEELNYIISRSEEHTSELQSRFDLVCRLLLEKKK